jgi:glycine betaine/proline transport system substrate-binding protein
VRSGGLLRRLTMASAALLTMALVAAGCGTIGGTDNAGGSKTTSQSGDSGGSGNGKTIKIGWIPWDEDIVVSNLWKQELEKKGYKVQLVQLDPGPLFTGLAKGDIDLFFDTWLPVTHKSYWDRYGKQLEDMGIWYDNATLALTVPNYVTDVKTISDLKGKASEFGGRITGIEAGAGLTQATEQKTIPGYQLTGEYELAKSSTPAMLAELQKAIKAKKPIVVTLWRPHWAYAKLPIHDLQDPKGTLGKAEKLHVVGRQGFGKDFPELKTWLSNFTMDDKHLGTLEDVALNQNKGKEAEGVAEWSKQNADFVSRLTEQPAK